MGRIAVGTESGMTGEVESVMKERLMDASLAWRPGISRPDFAGVCWGGTGGGGGMGGLCGSVEWGGVCFGSLGSGGGDVGG